MYDILHVLYKVHVHVTACSEVMNMKMYMYMYMNMLLVFLGSCHGKGASRLHNICTCT